MDHADTNAKKQKDAGNACALYIFLGMDGRGFVPSIVIVSGGFATWTGGCGANVHYTIYCRISAIGLEKCGTRTEMQVNSNEFAEMTESI